MKMLHWVNYFLLFLSASFAVLFLNSYLYLKIDNEKDVIACARVLLNSYGFDNHRAAYEKSGKNYAQLMRDIKINTAKGSECEVVAFRDTIYGEVRYTMSIPVQGVCPSFYDKIEVSIGSPWSEVETKLLSAEKRW